MAFPASNVTKVKGFHQIQSLAVDVKAATIRLRDSSAAGPTDRVDYVQLQRKLANALTGWATLVAIPGMEAVGRDAVNDPALDLQAEYVAMRDAAVALRDWIFNNIPRHDPSDAALLETVDQNGVRVPITVSSGAAAGFRAEADAFIATIG